MKIEGFLVLMGPELGALRVDSLVGTQIPQQFNHKFFETKEMAELSAAVTKKKCVKNGWPAHDLKIVRIECEGKEI